MNRKQRRAAQKEARKEGENQEIQEKIGLFHKLPDQCLTCSEPFDKTNRDMVMSWNVVVREQDQTVNLYCPDCWSKAMEIVEDFKQRVIENGQLHQDKG